MGSRGTFLLQLLIIFQSRGGLQKVSRPRNTKRDGSVTPYYI